MIDKNTHFLSSDVATAGALVINIAREWPSVDDDALGDLTTYIAADVAFWRIRRSSPSLFKPLTGVSLERREFVNRRLFEIYRASGATVPRITHGQSSGEAGIPAVDRYATELAALAYAPKAPKVKRPTGRPRGGYVPSESQEPD